MGLGASRFHGGKCGSLLGPAHPCGCTLHPLPFSSSISEGPVKTRLDTFTLPGGPKWGPSTLPSLHRRVRIWLGFMGSRQML